jgi:hypothetical protein
VTTPPTPIPDFASAKPAPKRVLWKWSFAIMGLLLVYFLWQCGTALYSGRDLSNASVREFHQKLNDGRYEEIYNGADEGFTSAGTRDEVIKFLTAVHTKLGNAGSESLTNVRVNSTTNGTFLVVQYSTTFDRGSATETFTWRKSNGALKLVGYNINSNALVVN